MATWPWNFLALSSEGNMSQFSMCFSLLITDGLFTPAKQPGPGALAEEPEGGRGCGHWPVATGEVKHVSYGFWWGQVSVKY